MKINNLSFPYPVLGIGNDVEPIPNIAEAKLPVKTPTTYIFETTLDMQNHDIQHLVKEGLAKYVCEVECPRTMLRKCFYSDKPHFKIELKRTALAEKVTFQYSIVAMKPIPGYFNRNFHPDYFGYTFDLEPGDLLAFIGQASYDVDIRYDKLKSVGSFMQITEGKMETMPKFILGGDKIEIKLPTPMYEQYRQSIMGDKQFSQIIHSSLVFNALVMALLYFADNEHTLWARTLKYRIDTEQALEKFKAAFPDLDQTEVMELAQTLLLNPYQRLFDSLGNLLPEDED